MNTGTCVPIYQSNVSPPYACVCPVTYTGQRCEQQLLNINPCSSNPCKLGSTCLPSPQNTAFTCLCVPNYTGVTCNIQVAAQVTIPPPIVTYTTPSTTTPTTTTTTTTTSPYYTLANGCYSGPCMNSGTCVSSQFGYLCNCPPGYMGLRCEQRKSIDLCMVNSCYNGGTCTTLSNNLADQYTVICYCPPGYTGSRCQTPVASLPVCQCYNNGLCRYDGSCQCQSGYYGTRCESSYQGATAAQPAAVYTTASSVCPAGLCLQGSCAQIPNGAGYYCICNWGWTGTRCTIRNYCQTYYSQCLNGAQCVNLQDGFTCVCNAGTTGQFCQTSEF
jgi:Notch-like protein